MLVQSANGGVLIVIENEEESTEIGAQAHQTKSSETIISANLLISPILSSVVAKKTAKDIDLLDSSLENRNILYISPIEVFSYTSLVSDWAPIGSQTHIGSISPSGP